jgi:nucleoside-diphosphate-sugar epimerase
MNIAITGGAGFIGIELVKKLISHNHHIRVLSRKSNYPIKGVELFVGDLTDPALNIDDFLNGIDVLYNCAGEVKDEKLMRDLHVSGTKTLIKHAKGRVDLWVQLSSVGAYGICRNNVITEESKESPVGTYEITKTESDNLVRDSGIDYVILRPSNVFGLSMSNQSLFQLIKLVKRKLFFYIGGSNALANYVHVNDVVKALILCSTKKSNVLKNVFIVSQTITIKQMIESFQCGLGFKSKPFYLPEGLIRILLKIINFIYSSFPLTESRVDALTSCCRYDSAKLESRLSFKFDSSLEKKFSYFSSNIPHENK